METVFVFSLGRELNNMTKKEKLKNYKKMWRIKNRELCNQRTSNWQKNNKEKVNLKVRNWRKKNKDRYKLTKQKNTKDYYIKHKEVILEKKRNYHRNNKDILNEKSREYLTTKNGIYASLKHSAERRALAFNMSFVEFIDWYNRQPQNCFYCKRTLEEIGNENTVVDMIQAYPFKGFIGDMEMYKRFVEKDKKEKSKTVV